MEKNNSLNENTDQELNSYINYFDDISTTSEMINKSIDKKKTQMILNGLFNSLNTNEAINTEKKLDENETTDEYKSGNDSFSLDEVEEYLKAKSQVREAFSNNAKTDRTLKIIYGSCLLGILLLQLIAVNVIFILGGLEILKYSSTTFNVFITGSLIEVAVIVRIVVKYLFTDNISKAFNNMMSRDSHIKEIKKYKS